MLGYMAYDNWRFLVPLYLMINSLLPMYFFSNRYLAADITSILVLLSN